MSSSAISLLVLVLAGTTVRAADWPQFLGPDRNGSAPETGLLTAWNNRSPKVLWKVPGGRGHSQVVAAAGRAFTVVERENAELLLALECATGKTVWSHRLGPAREAGSTPAVAGGRL